mgnify:CR=1 FL=1
MAKNRKSLTDAVRASSDGPAQGGHERAQRLSPEERSDIARTAAQTRWGKTRNLTTTEGDVAEPDYELDESQAVPAELPEASYKGVLRLLSLDIPCYVLGDGRRVIGRTSATEMLTGIKGGGALEKYLGVSTLRPFIRIDDIIIRMVSFRLPEVEGLERHVKGLPADALIEICQGFMAALEASTRPDATFKLTARQLEMALRAGMFVGACAKVGLEALIDEATGYQYERAQDALEVKLRAYLETEMRKWEKTFPDELWVEFGRLTGWSRSVTQRPKYWGRLVNELVYEYLDHDVAQWLRDNAPKPRHGQNYHQWLSSQYGLKKLVEHIWKLIGIAKTCQNMLELQDKMAELHGRHPIQMRMYVLPAKDSAPALALLPPGAATTSLPTDN